MANEPYDTENEFLFVYFYKTSQSKILFIVLKLLSCSLLKDRVLFNLLSSSRAVDKFLRRNCQ